MSTVIYDCGCSIVDFFFSKSISCETVQSTGGRINQSSPELCKLLNELGILSDRYQVIDLGDAPVYFGMYSWVSVQFSHSEDIVMVKLAFDQTGKTAVAVTEQLKQLDRKTTA